MTTPSDPSGDSDGRGVDLLRGPTAIREVLDEHCPEFVTAARSACEVQAFSTECTTRTDVPERANEAFGSMLVQVLNDWVDLLQACTHGMGRPAFRSARSIFEISLFGPDLFDDADTAERYLDHDILNELQLLEQSRFEGLTGARRRAAQHHRNKSLKRLRPLAEKLVERYGPGYRRSWTNESVRSRAERAGRLHEYAYYKYASGVAHGAASGRDGSTLFYPSDQDPDKPVPVYRLGGNFYYCVVALKYGLTSFRCFVTATFEKGVSSAEDVLHRLTQLEESFPSFENVMLQLHRQVSPEDVRPEMNVVALMYPTGVDVIYLHDVVGRRVIRARPHNPARVHDTVRRLRQESQYAGLTQSGWLMGERASPLPGAEWESEERIAVEHPPLIPRPGARVFTPDGAFEIGDDLYPVRYEDDDN